MRLSTDPDRDDNRGVATLRAALDAGVNLFDTADAYCHHAGDAGHNERLIASALADWDGDRSGILVITKGGLTRPQGQWVPDGRARHLAAACEASLRALGLDQLPLYQLHAPDPRVPFATSVRALDALRRQGCIAAVGLCNVTLGQLQEACQITEIATVQIELNPWQDAAILSGLVSYCTQHEIRLLAHRPLGGARRIARTLKDPGFIAAARGEGRSAADAVLAWLTDLSPVVTPLPGATRPDTARAIARARSLVLTDEDRSLLDERFPSAAALPRGDTIHAPTFGVRPSTLGVQEVVLIVGLPAAGKSTMARTFTGADCVRLNRDDRGGSLRQLLPELEQALGAGAAQVVLDNTYASRAARGAVIQLAARHGVPVRCVWLTAGIDDAQVNTVVRMIRKYGRLLEPDEIRAASRHDPNTFAPGVLFRVQREFEPPDPSEGFTAIDRQPFTRERDATHVNRALLVWCDGVLVANRPAPLGDDPDENLIVRTDRAPVLERFAADGYRIVALAWRPGIDDGSTTREQVDEAMRRVVDQLGVPMEFLYCAHRAGPPVCWCRSPLPGLGVLAFERYGIDPTASLCVGRGPHDAGFARKLGLQYRDAETFFGV